MGNFLLLLFFGYLVGSLSLGYFFGQIIKGIDIRKFGNHNTGATNTYRVVGPVYGILAGIFDFLKAPLVYYLALRFNLSPELAILPGLTAVLGHIFPFYLGFRGGRGVASLWGVCCLTLLFTQSLTALILILGSLVYAIIVSERVLIEAPLRKILKLSALVLPLGLLWLPAPLVWLVFALLVASLLFDLSRLLSRGLNQQYLRLGLFAKSKEKKRLSGYTLFLTSTFLLLWLFPKEIAVPALTFFILGDTLAPLFKPGFLPLPLIGQKTLGGALVIFAASFIAGLFLRSLTPFVLPMKTILVAAAITTILDQLSFLLDDNLLVPLGTAIGLVLLTS